MPAKHIAVMGIKGLPAKGGGERCAEAIIQEALAQGYRITVYAKKNYYEQHDIPGNLEIILIRDLPGKHLSAFSFGLFSCIHALLFKNFDLIHLHYADFGYIVPLLRLRFKVMVSSQGAEYNRDKWGKLAKLCFKLSEFPFIKCSNIRTCASAPLTTYYQQQYGEKVFYIPNGINPSECENLPQGVLEKYELSKNQYILFCAGRIIPSKGCDILLQANSLLGINIPLIIIGDMDSDPTYKKYLMSLAADNVRFIHFISTKRELFSIVANCRFFVFPSFYEAMSLMLLEVASLKKGIVCSDIPENYETIGENAIYFKTGQVNSMYNKIKYAIENPHRMEEMGEQACQWVIKNRNWQDIIQSYLKLYSEI